MTQSANSNSEALLRVGVVGVGVMGSQPCPRLCRSCRAPNWSASPIPTRKQTEFVARTLGCAAVATVDELLDLGVDAITIAAPTHLHRDVALACIARGVHVLVEKPIASTVEEGNEIIDAARARRRDA